MEDKFGLSTRLSVEFDLTRLPVLIAISAKKHNKLELYIMNVFMYTTVNIVNSTVHVTFCQILLHVPSVNMYTFMLPSVNIGIITKMLLFMNPKLSKYA